MPALNSARPRGSVVILIFGAIVSACGSGTTLRPDASSTGAAGSGSGGSTTGSGGAGGTSGTAGTTGTSGAGGTTGAAGATGAGGISGVGGGGGASACAQAASTDRSCTTDADCVLVLHTTNCCGSAVWMGIRSTAQPRFQTLEAACDRSYPACGCAAFGSTTDDGSLIGLGGNTSTRVGVTCDAGTCRTFAEACAHLCAAGRSCATCTVAGKTTGTCALHCMAAKDCTEAPATTCTFWTPAGLCVDPAAMCNQ
jgi:hypothetical protein